MTGTSMASPAVAGGAALVREYFRRGYHPTGQPRPSKGFVPSGALLKAVVVNSTVEMTGGVTGYPNHTEGWGRILLDDALYFPGDTRRLWLRDVRHVEGLETGQADEWRFRVTSSSQPLAITLAFMDQPAILNAAVAPVNDLDLEVTGGGTTYKGNVFDTVAGASIPGGSPDALNNVERVIVPVPVPGEWIVRVRGQSVPLGPQGYAVVANGGLDARDFRTGAAPEGPAPSARDRREANVDAVRLDEPKPNPFRTETSLRFGLTIGTEVEVRVHDVSGRVVRELFAGAVEAGEHRLVWDGRDGAGRRAGPGIYFLRLTAPGLERVVKTVLLR
jgi:hypothetical protein